MDEPSPDLFIDAAFAYLKTAAVKAAVALDLFTAIAQEDVNLERIAARTGASNALRAARYRVRRNTMRHGSVS
jgi:hypothetical protein